MVKTNNRVRISLIVLIFGSVVGLLAVQHFTTLPFAVKASYTTLGLITALLVFESIEGSLITVPYLENIRGGRCIKIILTLSALSIAALELLESPAITLGLFIPLGYGFLLLHFLNSKRVTVGMIGELTVLFSISSYSKFATTDFYIGSLDLIKHARFTREVIQTGTPAGIPNQYAQFPGLHILSGIISSITTLSPHDSIVLLGIVCFSALIGALFVFAMHTTKSSATAFFSVVLLSGSFGYLYFSNYFFPQSLAMTLFFFLLFTSSSALSITRSRQILCGILLSAAFVITHHFSFFIVLPVVLMLIAGDRWETYSSSETTPVGTVKKLNIFLIFFPYGLALYYWGNVAGDFFNSLLAISTSVFSTFTSYGISTGESSGNIFLYGEAPIEQTVTSAIAWLHGVEGVYQISLVALLTLGGLCLLFGKDRSPKALSALALGVLGAVLILETPLSVKSLKRLSFPLSIFAFILAGAGLRWMTTEVETRNALPVICIICLFVTAGPLMSADEVHNYQGTTDPTQASISSTEYEQLRSVSLFSNRYEAGPVSTFLVEREMLKLFEADTSDDIRLSESTINYRNSLMYNDNWTEYRLRHTGDNPYLNEVRMSEYWMGGFIGESDKYYDSGKVGLVK
ncbi:hypothetical protein [Haloarcula sp. Atlit-47R]|uniref:hypothetical protein n=1 Tax=Haloarcula sp. Atlit-47R TaxID=2282132 RepID=UPI0011C44B81|nr:hypothetical protein [Haloarcula sp. Atlit-47R]